MAIEEVRLSERWSKLKTRIDEKYRSIVLFWFTSRRLNSWFHRSGHACASCEIYHTTDATCYNFTHHIVRLIDHGEELLRLGFLVEDYTQVFFSVSRETALVSGRQFRGSSGIDRLSGRVCVMFLQSKKSGSYLILLIY